MEAAVVVLEDDAALRAAMILVRMARMPGGSGRSVVVVVTGADVHTDRACGGQGPGGAGEQQEGAEVAGVHGAILPGDGLWTIVI
jgi:hypothetical protein